MLYNQTFNLDQVAFASEGIKDAQQTVCSKELLFFLTDVHYRKIDLNEPFWHGHLFDWPELQYR
jgi:hypothetical protein